MKWLKILSIVPILIIITSIILIFAASFSGADIPNGVRLISLILSSLLYICLFYLGIVAKKKFFKITSLAVMIYALILGLYPMIILKLHFYAVIISSILYILFGLSFFELKEISSAKIIGTLIIISGFLSLIGIAFLSIYMGYLSILASLITLIFETILFIQASNRFER